MDRNRRRRWHNLSVDGLGVVFEVVVATSEGPVIVEGDPGGDNVLVGRVFAEGAELDILEHLVESLLLLERKVDGDVGVLLVHETKVYERRVPEHLTVGLIGESLVLPFLGEHRLVTKEGDELAVHGCLGAVALELQQRVRRRERDGIVEIVERHGAVLRGIAGCLWTLDLFSDERRRLLTLAIVGLDSLVDRNGPEGGLHSNEAWKEPFSCQQWLHRPRMDQTYHAAGTQYLLMAEMPALFP